MDFTYRIATDRSFDDTIEQVTAALKEQGFGVLNRIDMHQTLKDKLGVDTDPQVILGACNPQLAQQATQADPRIAALLPCNVVVRRNGDRTIVEALEPALMGQLSGNDDLTPIAEDASTRVRAALDAIN